MNLGQLIGPEFAWGERTIAEPVKSDAAGDKKKRSGAGGREQVLAYIRANGPVGCGGIAKGLGITSTHASVTLLDLFNRGGVERTGEPRHYLYTAKPE